MFQVRKILYTTDFSSYSNAAYFQAVALAEAHNAGLSIVFVYTPNNEGNREYWRDQLEQIRPVNPQIRVTHCLLEGDPAAEIIRYSRDCGMDLIVMGTHGRTGVDRLLLGSVAERVMREASCSVMVVKLPKGGPSIERPEVALVGVG